MNVICNAIGHTDISEDGIHTQCYHCGASKVHDSSSCEPCPWVPDAKCVPFERGNKENKQKTAEQAINEALDKTIKDE